MFIEQGYKGNLGKWNFFIIPVGFMLLMLVNYIMTAAFLSENDQSVEEAMGQMIEQFGKTTFLVINLLVFVAGLLAIFFWTKVINGQTIISLTTSRKKIDWKRIFAMFLFWGILSGGMILISAYSSPDDFQYNLNWSKFLPLVIISFLLFPFQTSFEEYLFRGQLMQGLGLVIKNRWVPFLVTSILFGLMHSANPEVEKLGPIVMVFYIGTGLFLGAMTLLDEGLELALGFHAANNIFAALMVTSSWTAIQTDSIFIDVSEPSFGLAAILPVVILYPLILLFLGKFYKWNNWKEKLFGKVLSREAFFAIDKTNEF